MSRKYVVTGTAMVPVQWLYVIEAHSSQDAVFRTGKLLSRPSGRPELTFVPAAVVSMATASQFVAKSADRLDK